MLQHKDMRGFNTSLVSNIFLPLGLNCNKIEVSICRLCYFLPPTQINPAKFLVFLWSSTSSHTPAVVRCHLGGVWLPVLRSAALANDGV